MKLKTAIRAMALTLLSAHAFNALASAIDPKIEACIRKNAPKATVVEKISLSSESLMYEEDEVLLA